jgi:type IV secretory pathway protease TraF
MSLDPAGHHGRFAVLVILSVVVTAGLMSVNSSLPRFIYNASQSAPIGWYRVEFRPPSRGDFVVIRPSETLQILLVAHAVLPPGIPLLKRVVAAVGDRVCRFGTVVSVNGEAIAEALERDQNTVHSRCGKGASPCSRANFSWSSRIHFCSTADISGR